MPYDRHQHYPPAEKEELRGRASLQHESRVHILEGTVVSMNSVSQTTKKPELDTRRSFVRSGARALLVGGAVIAGSRRLGAQDGPMGDTLNALIQCWNQYGPNGDNYGVN